MRTNKKKLDNTLTAGPGNVSKALGIYTHHTGNDLQSDNFFIADDGLRFQKIKLLLHHVLVLIMQQKMRYCHTDFL